MTRERSVLDTPVFIRSLLSTTGDGDLLDLHPFRGIAIVAPAAYVARSE